MGSNGVVVERVIEERDVDAALYLLNRVLGVADNSIRRQRLLDLQHRLEVKRCISDQDRREIVSAYYEVVG